MATTQPASGQAGGDAMADMLCQCGCDRPAPIAKQTNRRLGRIKGQPQRYIAGHYAATLKGRPLSEEQRAKRYESQRRRLGTVEDVFSSKVERGKEQDDCWVWTGCIGRDGYGQFKLRGRRHRAHRFAYELTYGAIPHGLWVLHKCDNPLCVRPAHLTLGTARDNYSDCVLKGRRPSTSGEHNSCSKLSNEQARCIYRRAWAGERGVDLAREYRVTKQVVSDIKLRKTYPHVTYTDEQQRLRARLTDHNTKYSPHAKLTDDQARDIYHRAWIGESHSALAHEYAVSKATISNIKRGETYAHVTQHTRKDSEL